MTKRQKQTLIIANPKQQGWNRLIAAKLMNQNPNMYVIDLYAEKFNPLLSENEIGVSDTIFSNDMQVRKYQEKISITEKLYIVYPIWWGSTPAILKGFFERVFSIGFAYSKEGKIPKGKLTNIQEVVIITTSSSPKWYIRFFGGNSVKKGIGSVILKTIGAKKIRWEHLCVTKSFSDEQLQKKVEKMTSF